MAKAKQYVLEGGDLETGHRVLTYGKCEKSPYIESGLWFVHVPRVTAQSTTFLVEEKYVTPNVMNEFDVNLEKWGAVAHKIIPGSDWNSKEECLWRDMPFYTYKLHNETSIRYGLSRSQSTKYPDRELWYIVIGLGGQKSVNWRENKYRAFVVDKICITPEFMEKMGSDPKRWQLIAWEAPLGIEPWDALIDDSFAPDPFYVVNSDKERPWWLKLVDTIFSK